MKKINNMVENSVKSYSQNYISDKDKNKFNNNVDNLECLSCLAHNRLHLSGRPSWNKGLKMPAETYIKMWATRRSKLNAETQC